MVELLVPIAKKIPITMSYGSVQGVLPRRLQGRSVVIRGRQEIGLLSQIFGGRDSRPRQPITLVGPDGRTPIMLVGMGEAETAELEDLAYEALEKAEKRGAVIPFAEYREKRGLPPASKFDALFKEALESRMLHHKRNWRSDPPRRKS